MQLVERLFSNSIKMINYADALKALEFNVLILVISFMSSPTFAQSLSPYSVFESMDQGELATLQVKLTYVGPQNKGLPSTLFTDDSNSFNITVFTPFQRPGINYSNDSIPPRTFKTSAAELEQVIDNVGTLPNVTAGDVASLPYTSFAMHNTISGGVAFESVLNAEDTRDLFDQIRQALSNNPGAILELNIMGCAIDALEAGMPDDVTADVSLSLSGVRLDRDADIFVGTLKVQNNSGSSIPGPISVAFSLPATTGLAEFDGFTCKFAPAGRKYVNLPLSGGVLADGESVEVTIEYTNPDLVQLDATLQVLSGTGAR